MPYDHHDVYGARMPVPGDPTCPYYASAVQVANALRASGVSAKHLMSDDGVVEHHFFWEAGKGLPEPFYAALLEADVVLHPRTSPRGLPGKAMGAAATCEKGKLVYTIWFS